MVPSVSRERGHASGSANTHHGNMFANARATRIMMFLHHGFGRRLNVGHFVWLREVNVVRPTALMQA